MENRDLINPRAGEVMTPVAGGKAMSHSLRLHTLAELLTGAALLLGSWAAFSAQFPGGFQPGSAQIEVLQSDPNSNNRREAARALGSSLDPTVIPALAQAAAFDSDRQVRIAAGDAIALIRRRAAAGWTQRPLGPNNYRLLVESWYQLYLRRPADPAGLRDFVDRMRRGAGPIEVQAALLGSDEYFRLHGGREGSWVAALYTDVLDRSPSHREVQDWIQTLRRSGGSRESTAAEFLRAAQAELTQRPR
jgi:hypothetical protein